MRRKQAERLTPLKVIGSWRQYVKLIVKAVSRIKPEAKVYVTGGAAENRLTVLSDIDVLVVLPYKPGFREAVELRVKILEEAMEQGLPLYAPIEIHVIGEEELARYARKGRVVEV